MDADAPPAADDDDNEDDSPLRDAGCDSDRLPLRLSMTIEDGRRLASVAISGGLEECWLFERTPMVGIISMRIHF